jgi:xylan 1,4-beta-xylosidase
MRTIIENSPYPDAELHVTEWSTSPSSRDAIHDTLFAAAYIVRAFLKGSPLADSISYWTFTDVFEEGGAGIGPFHGGFGLVNEQGLHKPTFHAMAMLNRLGDRLLAELPHGVITRSSATGEIAAIFSNYPDDMGEEGLAAQPSYAQARALAAKGPARRVRHTVEGLTPGATFEVEVLDWEHGNVAVDRYRMGAPLNLSREQTATLRDAADRLDRSTLTVSADGVLEIDLVLPAWAVASVRPATDHRPEEARR